VVATKSYAYSAEGAKESLEKARKEMDIDVIDILCFTNRKAGLP